MTAGLTTDTGYTCSKCGAWVPTGNYHSCDQMGDGLKYFIPLSTPAPTPADPKLLELLERIATALERLA